MPDLVRVSLDVIRSGQHASGAFVAAPKYAPYGKAWLRDGAFCAIALDRFAEHDSAARFHSWVAAVVRAEARGLTAPSRTQGHYLRARYPLDFPERPAGTDRWCNFQLDGPGLWLVAIAEHLRRSRRPFVPYRDAATVIGRYLHALGGEPCCDCWEEHVERVHGSTLAAVAGGLHALHRLGLDEFAGAAEIARLRLTRRGADASTFVKWEDSRAIDASLQWCAVIGAVAADDPLMRATVARVRSELNEGRTRYKGDPYYGGGQWLLLAGLAGWHAVLAGDGAHAEMQRAWIEEHAEPDGALPEQVPEALERPDQLARTEREAGPAASPLLWSHAMYLILRHALADGA